MKKVILGMGMLVILMASFSKAEGVREKDSEFSALPAEALYQVSGGELLINKSDCMGCHHKSNKMIGPSYLSIAQKYKPTEKNLDALADKIIKGGTGVWGTMPMSAHPSVKKADAVLMAKYILSVKK